MINRQERKSGNYSKKVGFVHFELLGFNPKTNEEKRALGGYVKEEEKLEDSPVYVAEKDGVAYIRLDFYLQEVGTDFRYQKTLFLRDEIRVSKNEAKFNDKGEAKIQFINQIGRDLWAFSEKDLSDKFKANDFHPARSGETEIISFLKALFALRFKEELSYDWKKVLKGNFSEIATEIKENAKTIILPMEVELKPTDTGVKEIQTNYNFFIPGEQIKFLNSRNGKPFTKKDIDAIKAIEASNDELYKRGNTKAQTWIIELDKAVVKVSENSKNCYYLGAGKEYNSADFEQTSGSTVIDDEFESVAVAEDDLPF